jgi:prolyl-tRNA editing enzyme YbaK/EbsC (Cys-tRNA(Pro) deacylase)
MIPDKVMRALSAHGLSAVEFEPGSCATSVLAAKRFGVSVGQIAKSLLFVGKNGKFFLVLCPGDRRVSSSKLKAVTGVKSRMASAEEAREATGFPPGGVCPFGVDASVTVYIDKNLSGYQTIFPAAGTDGSGVPMSFDKLVAATGGLVGEYLAEQASSSDAPEA